VAAVVGVVPDVARGAEEGADDAAGALEVAGGAVEAGASLDGTSGDTVGTVVVGELDVLDAATPASRPTPATPPAAMISVRLPTRVQPASRSAGVRGVLVTPVTLAGLCKSQTAGR
jgi:hypothetical protein